MMRWEQRLQAHMEAGSPPAPTRSEVVFLRVLRSNLKFYRFRCDYLSRSNALHISPDA